MVLPSAAATCTPLRASASSMLVCASLNLRPPATAPSSGFLRLSTPPSAPPTPPALSSEKMTLGVRMKSRRHHLPAAHVRALAQLAGLRELALLHDVLHADAPLDDDEAVRLLDHHANQAGRRLQAVAIQRLHDVVLRLDDGQRAHRLVALLDGSRPCRRPCRPRR